MEKISIVIPVRNEEKGLEKLISQLLMQKGINSQFSMEVLFVDGKSSDKSALIIKTAAKKNKNIKLISNPKKTTPTGLNLGIKNAKGKYVCILNAHAEVAKDYMFQALRISKLIGADNVGGAWFGVGKNYISNAIALTFCSPYATGIAKSHNPSFSGYVSSVWGGFLTKKTLENIGGFDETFVRNQDDELNFRLIKAGGKIYQSSKIRLKYYVRDSLWQLFKQYYQYGYWRIKFIQKHKQPASLRQIIPILFILAFMILGIGSIFNNLLFNILIIFLLIYLSIILMASSLAMDGKIKYFPILPIIFFCYHFGYGLGMIQGFFDFIIFHQSNTKMSNLTR